MKTFLEFIEDQPPFAVFVLVFLSQNEIAATTRASDRNEEGKIGLPGGKIDEGETPEQAAEREAREEGWEVSGINPDPIHKSMVEGKMVWWFKADKAIKLDDFKEKHRIKPIIVTKQQIVNSGYGNEFIANL